MTTPGSARVSTRGPTPSWGRRPARRTAPAGTLHCMQRLARATSPSCGPWSSPAQMSTLRISTGTRRSTSRRGRAMPPRWRPCSRAARTSTWPPTTGPPRSPAPSTTGTGRPRRRSSGPRICPTWWSRCTPQPCGAPTARWRGAAPPSAGHCWGRYSSTIGRSTSRSCAGGWRGVRRCQARNCTSPSPMGGCSEQHLMRL
mmetsp:Transcript_9173/g.25764  ORF Transcript_9173/g.25764 Transcript_9173/m.25764 type:complete len:200 (-) Transcript_9173:31-630(-)